MPYRLDPNTGQFVWDGSSVPQTTRDSLGTQIRELQAQIDALSFIDLDDVPTTYTGQSGKILSVKSTEDGLEFVENTGGAGVSDGDKGDVIVSSSGTVWSLDTTGVTAGSYTLLGATIDAKGRITAASSGTVSAATISDGTTVGRNILKLTNPGAVTFLRMNADNTVTARTPSETRTDLSLGGAALLSVGTTSGTVAAGDDSRFHAALTLASSVSSVLALSGQQIQAPADLAGDRIVFVDVTAGGLRHLIVGDGLQIVDDTLSSTINSGGVDNAIIRANGTAGASTQGSSIVIDDAQISPTPAVCLKVVHAGQTNSALVLTPMGNGAFILGPVPDNTTTGGVSRGANAVDLQSVRGNPNHVASGQNSAVLGGNSNYAAALNSATLAGLVNTAGAAQSVAHGSRAIANRINMIAHGNAAANGECQAGRVIMRRVTTDATPVPLSMDGAAPSGSVITTSTHFILANNQALSIGIRIIARSASGANHARFLREIVMHRDANAASTTLDNEQTIGTDFRTAGASGWGVTLTALATSTDGGLLITVTGASSTTISWAASLEFMEIIRA